MSYEHIPPNIIRAARLWLWLQVVGLEVDEGRAQLARQLVSEIARRGAEPCFPAPLCRNASVLSVHPLLYDNNMC